MLIVPASHYVVPTTMIDVIKHLGLTTSLQLVLDAGDSASYDGTSQAWEDLSGNNYDFYRGTGSGSDAADPSFNGVAGRQGIGEYFGFDGGDTFTLGQATPSWISALHKNNATGTMAAWVRVVSSASVQILLSTYSVTAPSMQFSIASLRVFYFANDGVVTTVIQQNTAASVTADTWAFVAFSIDEATGTLILQINGVSESLPGTYTSPSASDANVPATIGRDTDATLPILSGGRMAAFMGWSRALSSAELTSLYDATKAKFGL